MLLLKIIKLTINLFVQNVKEIVLLAKLQLQFPNCEFYLGATISNSSFEGYNVIFKNVILDSSKLGAHSYIQKHSTVFNAEIGRFCSIGSYVSIAPGIHKTDGVSTHPAFYLKNTPLLEIFSKKDYISTSSKVIIGHDVWIAESAIILDGLTIGTGAIIAAGSVVTGNVEPYAVVGGVPAKVIKYRFSEEVIAQLIKSQWWNQPNDWFKNNYMKMHNIKDFFNSEE